MKKLTAYVTAILLLLSLPVLGVSADETTTTTTTETTTTTAQTTTTVTESETTTTTTTEVTTTTTGTTGVTQIEPQTLEVELDVSVQGNGLFAITATDREGRPVAGYRLYVQVGAMTFNNAVTNANGVYNCLNRWNANDKLTYGSYGDAAQVIGINTYLPVARVTIANPNAPTTAGTTVSTTTTTAGQTTTTAKQETTSTEEVTGTTTTVVEAGSTTVGLIFGDRTTAYRGDKVLTNVVTDNTVLTQFGYERQAFLANAGLEISKKDYGAIAGNFGNYTVMLNVGAATVIPSTTMLEAALKDSGTYGHYQMNDHQVTTFHLSLIVLDSTGEVVPQSNYPANATYVIQLPVPESMKDADELAITIPAENGLQTPVPVEVHDGCIRLQVNALPENYTLIAFAKEEQGSDVFSLILYIVGGLLLIGAGLLLYFFVFRKPKPAAEENQDEVDVPEIAALPQDDEDNIFSGRTDIPAVDPAPTQEPIPPSDEE